jgi:hypothetical protein
MTPHITVLGGPDMMGDLLAPAGSFHWCVGMKNEIAKILRDHASSHEQLARCLDCFKMERGWTQLPANTKGNRFLYYEDFCKARPPYGLGMKSDAIDAIVEERRQRDSQQGKAQAKGQAERALGEHGGAREQGDNFPICHLAPSSPRGNDATYRVRKLRRDHPEIADRLAAGEFKSVAAAERAARGEEPHPPRRVATALEILWRVWARATDQEQAAFLAGADLQRIRR